MARVAVLGGGNTAFSIAAKLALDGWEVLVWEHPICSATLDPIRESLTIQLAGPERSGAAKLAGVTTDAREALGWSDLLLCSVPSYAHTRAELLDSSEAGGGEGSFSRAAASTAADGTKESAAFGIRVARSRRAPSSDTIAVIPGCNCSPRFSTVMITG